MFKLKSSFSKEEKENNLKQLREMLDALPAHINEIKYFETGMNVSASPAAFDLVLVSEFESLETLEAYRVHPEHVKVLDFVSRVKEVTHVVDYNMV